MWNLAGVGLVGAGTYLGGKLTSNSFSFKNSHMPYIPRFNSRKRSVSVYAAGPNAGRPVKRRRGGKVKSTSSTKKTFIKSAGKGRRRTKRNAKSRRRAVKKTRRTRKRSWGLFQKLGILRTAETGISTTGVTDAGFIGHASFRPTGLMTDFILCLLKTAYARQGIQMRNVGDVVPVDVGSGVEMYIKPDSGSATAVVSVGHAYLGGETWSSTAGLILADIVSSVLPGNLSSTSIVGINLSNPGGTPTVRLNLIGSKIVVKSESWLKIQNQTVTSLGSEEDEVDRCPVLMNKYWGYGTGAYSNRMMATESQLIQNQTNGLIHKVGTLAAGTSEAPPRSYFTGCKSKKQFVLAPGHFASSKAYFNSTIAIEKFWPMITSQYLSSSTINYYPYGSWNLFHFEHLIKPKQTTSNLIVNGEVNFRTGCFITLKKYVNTDEKIDTAQYETY